MPNSVAVGTKKIAPMSFFHHGLPFQQAKLGPIESFLKRVTMMQFKYGVMAVGAPNAAIKALATK
jgi:hypothetical protein